jgi:hypothetical protein
MTSSGGPVNANPGGGGASAPVKAPTPGGGGGGSKTAPGAMAFASGCGAIDTVANTATLNPGGAAATIVTKVAETNCVNVYFKVDFVNASTGQIEFTGYGFNFTTTPYSLNIKDITALPNTLYETRVTVWNATLGPDYTAPLDPSWILATESFTVTTVGAPINFSP